MKEIDWKKLKKEFLEECVKNDLLDGEMIKYDLTPHDVFRWFKNKIQEK